MSKGRILLIVAMLQVVTACQHASSDEPYLAVGQQVVPPMGFIGFCLDDPTQCEGGTDAPARAAMTSERWLELNKVNDFANATVAEINDLTNYGVSERWSYPNATGGDCEDIALLKRKLLIERGWSPSDLLIAVVRLWNGEGHAVLVVATDKGDYVLDNLDRQIKRWDSIDYTWVKMQSSLRPFQWLNLDRSTFRINPLDHTPPLGAPIPFVLSAQSQKTGVTR